MNTRQRFVRQLATFAGGSGVGLLLDLGLFTLLSALGASPWLSNVVSSVAAVTLVYVVATRHAFGVQMTVLNYTAFIAWYMFSIALISVLISLGTMATGWHPLALKLLSVPFSFCLNFVFSRWLFRRPIRPASGDDDVNQ